MLCFVSLLGELLNKLTLAQNNVAKMVTKTEKYDRITQLLYKLHWLPIRYKTDYKIILLLDQVRLRTEVLPDRPGFKLMTARSWQYLSCHWDARSNHLAISDFCYKALNNLVYKSELLHYKELTGYNLSNELEPVEPRTKLVSHGNRAFPSIAS